MLETAGILDSGIVSEKKLKIYAGILGQIGDIVIFSATLRRIRQLFPNAEITLAVAKKYREAGELLIGLPYADRLFTTELYFEKLTEDVYAPWHLEWPVDLRGDDERAEQAAYDIILETRPRHKRHPWWEFAHVAAELAHIVGVPGPIDLRTEIAIPKGVVIPEERKNKVVIHNDPSIDETKGWSKGAVSELCASLPEGETLLLGGSAADVVPSAIDLRGKTTLAEAARIIEASRCYIGIDSGLMWIAASLQVPVIGIYGTSYIPNAAAVQPHNPNARYFTVEGPAAGLPAGAVADALREILAEG